MASHWLCDVQDRVYKAPLDLVTQSSLATRLGPSPRPQRPDQVALNAAQEAHTNATTQAEHVKGWRRNARMPVPRLCPQTICTTDNRGRQLPMLADAHTQTICNVAIQVSCVFLQHCLPLRLESFRLFLCSVLSLD